MSDFIEQLIDKLRDPALATWLRDWSVEVNGQTWGIYYNERPGEGDYSDLEGNWLASLDWALQLHGAPPRDWPPSQYGCGDHLFLEKADKCLKQVPGIPVITVDELYTELLRYLEADMIIHDEMYDHLLDHIRYHVVRYHDTEIAVCDINELPSEYDHFLESARYGASIGYLEAKAQFLGESPSFEGVAEDSEDELIPHESIFNRVIRIDPDNNSFELRLERLELIPREIRTFDAVEIEKASGILHGRFTARCSANVMGSMERRLRRLVPTVMRTSECAMEGRLTKGDRRPSFTLESVHAALDFLKHCLQSSFTVARGKDSFHRRIANATELLAESDQQENDAVAAALSVAAIEAMVGKKGDAHTTAVAERVATLLEPEPSQRKNADALARKIYNIRSRTLHGENIDAEQDYRDQARILASAVVYAVWHRLTFLRRAGGDPENPDDLIKELKDRKWDSSPQAMPDLPAVQKLWRI